MTSIRIIIHLDLDAFFCAVEEQRDPSLHSKAFAVGGRPESRGVVASASYAARQFGVRSAMPMAQAVRLCPDLILVFPNFSAYRAASQQVMERLHRLTPLVEQISIDEAFLDVTALGEPGKVIAARLQATIREVIAEAALRLFGQLWTGEQAVRLIGVGVSGLGSPPRQLSLWDAPIAPTPEQLARQQWVEVALAAIQARFGAGAVGEAMSLENHERAETSTCTALS